MAPVARITPALLVRYVADLEARVASQSVLTYVEAVAHFCRAAAPDLDWTWLTRVLRRLKRRVVPARLKHRRIVPTQDLLALGQRVMCGAEDNPDPAPWRTASRYRDGLMVALLALRPLRLRNFTDIAIGQHLVRHGDGYRLCFTAAETKTRRALAFAVPAALVPSLDRYLSHHRPLLCARAAIRSAAKGAPAARQLWVSGEGSAMIDRSVYESVVKLTLPAFGQTVYPHLFRDCAATTIATDDPEHVHITTSILGHTSLATSERFYNHAQSLEASRRYHACILQLRREVGQDREGDAHPDDDVR